MDPPTQLTDSSIVNVWESVRNTFLISVLNGLGILPLRMCRGWWTLSYFQFALTGWEGTAHDGKVLRDALVKEFKIKSGKYYLGDADYALKPYCLTL